MSYPKKKEEEKKYLIPSSTLTVLFVFIAFARREASFSLSKHFAAKMKKSH